jgi:hypothetical protein
MRTQCDNTRNDDKERLRLRPDDRADGVHVGQNRNRSSNLVHLNSAINQESNIANTQADDLNRVLHTESIVDQDEFVEETEGVKSEESGDGFGRRTVVRDLLDLEVGKDVTKRDQYSIFVRKGDLHTIQDPVLLVFG